MINSLLIKSFALIAETEVKFQKGLNILTGESGAGKSILVNALSQLCGERSSIDFVKAGAKKAIIEAEFSIPESNSFIQILKSHALDVYDEKLIIRKEINQSGSSRIFINDSPVQLSILNQISFYLIDLHGQHQHQVLLHPENHLDYLDSYANLQSSVKDFVQLVTKYENIKKQFSALEEDKLNALQMSDLYNFQLQELKAANLEEGEIEKLEEELKILSNYEKLHDAARGLTDKLSTDEFNAAQLVTNALRDLENLSNIDNQFEEFLKNLTAARETIEEISQFTDRYLSTLEFDADRMEFIRQRISQIEFLIKKYQKTSAHGLIEHIEDLTLKLAQIENYDEHLEALKSEKNQIEKIIIKSGQELSLKRKQAAREFENKLGSFLTEIGMVSSKFQFSQSFVETLESPFEINGKKVKLLKSGFDDILIKFSPNPGEQLKPINKIASGGEISRIMLALKSVLAEKDKIPLLVFDEIDSGISGKTALVVGKKISELARYHQIICITHLPQIAAFADHHYKVDKNISLDSTAVSIASLNFDDQITEIANLLGGEEKSQQAIDNATQLLSEASRNK